MRSGTHVTQWFSPQCEATTKAGTRCRRDEWHQGLCKQHWNLKRGDVCHVPPKVKR